MVMTVSVPVDESHRAFDSDNQRWEEIVTLQQRLTLRRQKMGVFIGQSLFV